MTHKKASALSAAAILFLSQVLNASPEKPLRRISLGGEWKFSCTENYDPTSKETILLPGSMPERLKGNIPDEHTLWTGSVYDSSFFHNPALAKYRTADNFKPPFFLTPDRHYVGPAWYSREVQVPMEWKGRRVVLKIERPHIHTDIWVNGKAAGRDSSLCVAHSYDITRHLLYGRSNLISIKVDNRTDRVGVGDNSHSVSDQTQGNWNGMVGELSLESTPAIWADDIQVYPDIRKRSARVEVTVRSLKKSRDKAVVRLKAHSFNSPVTDVLQEKELQIELKDGYALGVLTLEFGSRMQLWDEFSPALYHLDVQIASKYGTHEEGVDFGMREFKV